MGSRVLDNPPCYRQVCSSRSQLCLEVPHKSVQHAAEKQNHNVKSQKPIICAVFLLLESSVAGN